VDITIHEKLAGGKLREKHKATGGAWGGTAVDHSFNQLLVRIVGGPVMSKFAREHKADHIDLFREFEAAKRVINDRTSGKVNMKIPVSLNDVCREVLDEDLKSILAQDNCPFKGKIQWLGDKMRVDAVIMKGFFQEAVNNIVEHIRDLLSLEEARGVSMMLLVGGFADSPMVQEAIKKAFQDGSVKVLIPHQAGLAVLMGAVIFGHKPDGIASRIMRCTYGVEITPEFIPGKHPPEKKHVQDGTAYCRGVFGPFMTMGTSVDVGDVVAKTYTTVRQFQDACDVKVYTSTEQAPTYVTDDSCQFLGNLTAKVANPTKEERDLDVVYMFGGTELQVSAAEKETGIPCTATFTIK
jgi:hypothetical protein